MGPGEVVEVCRLFGSAVQGARGVGGVPEHVEQFIVGTDWAVWERADNGSGWSKWRSTQGIARSSIKVVNNNSWQPMLHILGDDGNWWERNRWAGRWSKWYRI
ncbi:hypothetical protein [Streptomyces sp. NPDC090445]|uniref:hypothetical protein n=1 Tax=Streptomyces sp. NPDC090445 TaxID=3365963 RepID=UPI0038162F2E